MLAFGWTIMWIVIAEDFSDITQWSKAFLQKLLVI
jgi:hypothetical protein